MQYITRKPFLNIDGSFLRPGDVLECESKRARILMRNGLIGSIAESDKPSIPERNKIETAEEKPGKRKYRKRDKTESVASE